MTYLCRSRLGIDSHRSPPVCRRGLRLDLDNAVYALDASTIDLHLSVFPWALSKPGQSERYDVEYERNGVTHLLAFYAPFENWRHLNPHGGASLYKAFPPHVAHSLLDKLACVYTPKHGLAQPSRM